MCRRNTRSVPVKANPAFVHPTDGEGEKAESPRACRTSPRRRGYIPLRSPMPGRETGGRSNRNVSFVRSIPYRIGFRYKQDRLGVRSYNFIISEDFHQSQADQQSQETRPQPLDRTASRSWPVSPEPLSRGLTSRDTTGLRSWRQMRRLRR